MLYSGHFSFDEVNVFQWVSDTAPPEPRKGDAEREYKEAVPFIEFI